MIVAPEISTAKPYLLRAMYEWCCDQGLTPYVSVYVDEQVQVPMEFVRKNEITFNVGMDATNSLLINNETLEFKARFGGVPRHVMVPVTHVIAIYGRENGEGMVFPFIDPSQLKQHEVDVVTSPAPTLLKPTTTSTVKKEKSKPTLTIVK